jgi:hypothetical protein
VPEIRFGPVNRDGEENKRHRHRVLQLVLHGVFAWNHHDVHCDGAVEPPLASFAVPSSRMYGKCSTKSVQRWEV